MTTEKKQLSSIRHLGIIMDGNRRWAQSRGMPGLLGHQEGYANLKRIIPAVFDREIKVLTLFAFSTENWKRSAEEVDHLLKLFAYAIKEEMMNLAQRGLQVRFIGDISEFPQSLKEAMKQCEKETENNSNGILNIAVNYGGRNEIVHAVKEIVKNNTPYESITEELISQNMYTYDLPDPDLIIRTSGEQRVSGFLTWQSAYSELLFIKKQWPEFSVNDLDEALAEYQNRQRRFGS